MYKPLADSTLHSMTKKELIELLRTAEHNAKVSQEWVAQQAENIKDWAPVVRCKDCKDWGSGLGGIPICRKTNKPMSPYDFCSYGERGEADNA